MSRIKFSVSPRGSGLYSRDSCIGSVLPVTSPHICCSYCTGLLSPTSRPSLLPTSCLLFLSYPWRSSAPCTLCCQVSVPRRSRPSLNEFWLGLVLAWALSCQGFRLARPLHCCRPFGYENGRMRYGEDGWGIAGGHLPCGQRPHVHARFHAPMHTDSTHSRAGKRWCEKYGCNRCWRNCVHSWSGTCGTPRLSTSPSSGWFYWAGVASQTPSQKL